MTRKESLSIVVACVAAVGLVISFVMIGIGIFKRPERERIAGKDDSAKVFVVDQNGTCWSAGHGNTFGEETVIRSGFGPLFFRNPAQTLILKKPASDKRISKILQLDIKHCVRIDK